MRQKPRIQLRGAGLLRMKGCKIGAALVPRERGPGLNPVPNVPEIGANMSILNCDYNLAPY
jgi:hypothetical protein